MRCKIIQIQREPSNQGDWTHYRICMQDSKGNAYKTDVAPFYKIRRTGQVVKAMNFPRWKPIIDGFFGGQEIWLDNILIKEDRTANADSAFFYYRRVWPQEIKNNFS